MCSRACHYGSFCSFFVWFLVRKFKIQPPNFHNLTASCLIPLIIIQQKGSLPQGWRKVSAVYQLVSECGFYSSYLIIFIYNILTVVMIWLFPDSILEFAFCIWLEETSRNQLLSNKGKDKVILLLWVGIHWDQVSIVPQIFIFVYQLVGC